MRCRGAKRDRLAGRWLRLVVRYRLFGVVCGLVCGFVVLGRRYCEGDAVGGDGDDATRELKPVLTEDIQLEDSRIDPNRDALIVALEGGGDRLDLGATTTTATTTSTAAALGRSVAIRDRLVWRVVLAGLAGRDLFGSGLRSACPRSCSRAGARSARLRGGWCSCRLIGTQQPLLAAKRRDLGRRGLELMGDPDIGDALGNPRADLIELRFERRIAASHPVRVYRPAV